MSRKKLFMLPKWLILLYSNTQCLLLKIPKENKTLFCELNVNMFDG